jgi:hypothetical protein
MFGRAQTEFASGQEGRDLKLPELAPGRTPLQCFFSFFIYPFLVFQEGGEPAFATADTVASLITSDRR